MEKMTSGFSVKGSRKTNFTFLALIFMLGLVAFKK